MFLILLSIAVTFIFSSPLRAQVAIDGRVLVEDGGGPLAGVKLVLQRKDGQAVAETVSADGGHFTFEGLQPDAYRVVATKSGFFDLRRGITVNSSTALEVVLARKDPVSESINVQAQPVSAELQGPKPGVHDTLTYDQIQLLPTGNSRNVLDSLPLSSSVVQDRDGKLHLRGASSQNIQYQVDGINVTDPVKGGLQNSIPSDSVQTVEVVASGYAPEFGKSAGGIVRAETGAIPDKWKLSLTDMMPNYSFRQHAVSEFVPRFTIRGPVGGQRLSVLYGLSGEYRQLFDEDLPEGANSQQRISGDHVIRTRYTFSDLHIASATILLNHGQFRNHGLNRESPIETSTNDFSHSYSAGFRDRLFFNDTTALESMIQLSGEGTDSRAKGTAMYRIWPDKRRGNYNIDEGGHNYRRQWNEDLTWSAPTGRLTHQIKTGVELSFKYYRPRFELRPTEFFRSNSTLLRRSRYEEGHFEPYSNRETGFYIQDTVTLRNNITATYGIRGDSDETTRDRTVAPRLGVTWFVGESHRSRISGGVGYFYDRLLLSFLVQDQFPSRSEFVYTDDGSRVAASYVIRPIRPGRLQTPVSRNWDLEIEREIARQWIVRAGYIRRSGWRELQQIDVAPPSMRNRETWLAVTNTGLSDYQAFDISMDRSWGRSARASVAYTHSRSLQSLQVDPLALKIQEQDFEVAPSDWDAPHRLVAWAMFPFFRQSRMGMTVESHSGFPFSVRDQFQEIIGHRNGHRFPAYFNLGLSIEREFPFTPKYRIAVRLSGFNITNHYNPSFIDSNLDSPEFMMFGNSPRPGGNVRLRLIKR